MCAMQNLALTTHIASILDCMESRARHNLNTSKDALGEAPGISRLRYKPQNGLGGPFVSTVRQPIWVYAASVLETRNITEELKWKFIMRKETEERKQRLYQ